jgi:hypothetical protein
MDNEMVVEPTADPTPPAEPPQEPDLQALLEQERAAKAELEAKLAAQSQASDANYKRLEDLVVARFNQAPPAAPEPEPVIDRDAYLDNPDAAVDQKIERKLAANNAKVAEAMKTLAERSFQSDYAAMRVSNPEIFDKLKPQIDEFYAANPNERYRPGSVEQVYKYYVGENFSELAKEFSAARPPVPAGTATTPNAPTGPTPPPKEGPKLTERQRRLAAQYGIPEEEYLAIEENKHEVVPPRYNAAEKS